MTTSGMFGDYHFNIPSGQYSVTCSAEGFDEQIIDELELSAEQVIRLNFSLTPSSDSADPEIYDQQNEFYFYPNPFTDGTRLYSCSRKIEPVIIVEIYNLKGQIIQRLSSGNLKWNGKDYKNNSIPQGIYLYNIQSGEKNYHGKLIFLDRK